MGIIGILAYSKKHNFFYSKQNMVPVIEQNLKNEQHYPWGNIVMETKLAKNNIVQLKMQNNFWCFQIDNFSNIFRKILNFFSKIFLHCFIAFFKGFLSMFISVPTIQHK